MKSKLIKKQRLENQVKIQMSGNDFLVRPVQNKPRHDWERKFKVAISNGDLPDNELQEGFSNDFEKDEWTW
ncbi:hypothetical protein [Persicitalea sp.]|uniref:hypothetical protein n=1 Tax=Persicitalea sp. TaxID=3100273 RepID=UPI0035930F0B